MTVTIAEWHDRTYVPGREYYPIGNRHLYGVVQTDVSGPGAPVTLVFGDPDYFDGPKGMKRDALLFHPERGLDVTALTVSADGRPFRALHTNVRALWDPEGAPVLTVRWWAGPLVVEEKIFASMKSPIVYRRVRIENRAEFPCVPAVRADFVPNPRMAGAAVKLTDRGLAAQSTLGDFGLFASATWEEAARAVLPSDGEPGVELRLSELQPGESATITLIYALCREQAHLMDLQGLDEAAIDQEEASTRSYRAEGAVISCHDSLAQHVFDSAYRGILMATSDEGRLNVGMWQYNKQWVRDSCQTALGALHVGLHEEAGLALRKVLTDLVDDEGRTIIADAFVDERHEQFDQAGQLLFALSQYVLWTGDTSIVRDHWSRISAAADRLCNSPCRDPQSGLFHNEREFWERSDIHGVEEGFELSYQLWPVLGLTSTPVFQRAMPSDDVIQKTGNWAKTGREIWQAAMGHPTLSFIHEGRLIKRRRLDGSIQETMTPHADLKLPTDIPLGNDRVSFLNPDTSSVVPIAYGLVDPSSDVAQKTVDWMETLWNLRWDFGGYDRYHTSSQPDTPGPWGFASMFVARANHACGNLDRTLRTIHWFATTAGGKGGAWYEYVPIIQTDMEREVLNPGIVLWIWAEMGILFTRQVLGITPEIEGVRIKPRLLPGMGEVRANVPLRGLRLELELYEERPEAGRVRYGGGDWQSLKDGELFLPWT